MGLRAFRRGVTEEGLGPQMMSVKRSDPLRSLIERLDLGYTAPLVAVVVLFLVLVATYFGAI